MTTALDISDEIETGWTAVPEPVGPAYRLARCEMLEGRVFEGITSCLRPVTHSLSNLLMPAQEYPRLIASLLEADAPVLPLVANLDETAARIGELNKAMVQLCHNTEGVCMEIDLGTFTADILAEVVNGSGLEQAITVQTRLETAPVYTPNETLYYAVRHLLTNAVEAMPDGGVLDVRTETVTVEEADQWQLCGVRPGVFSRLSVADTGKGVEPAFRDNLFAPFVTSLRHNGLGIGLSLVYRTALHFNGYVLYNPDRQPGSDFALWLPQNSD
jgi:signal transduction histidine kinase